MRSATRWKSALAVAVAATLTLGAAACGDSRDDDSSSGGDTSDTTAAGGEAAFTIDTDQCASYEPDTGVTEDSIKIGSSFPQSGTFAAFAKISVGYQAYFNYVNANGGIDGREIELVTKNDEYDPQKTRTNAQELVQSEGVFGLFNVVGTPNNLAIRDDLADACVPNLFVATGSQLWGETDAYPWLIGSIPSYATEAAIFADWLKANQPEATVAILKQNDDFGEGYETAFRAAIEGSDITIVDVQSYNPTDPDVKSQITTMAASGADTALLAATALKCPQALNAVKEAGWTATTYISATCTSSTVVALAPDANNGVLSSIYLKDPSDPQWDDDAAMQEFQTLGAQYGVSAEDLSNGIVGYGWTMGALLVETLKQSPELTRKAVMEKAYTLSDLEVGLLLPGISINTNGAEDPFPIEQMQIGQYNGSFWELQGEVVSFEGQSGEYAG
jgi:branched-chain amino acid transport system substrate-binding protein